MEYQVVAFEKNDEVLEAYEEGRCDVLTTDQSGLYAERLKLAKPGRSCRSAGNHLQGAAWARWCARATMPGSTS